MNPFTDQPFTPDNVVAEWDRSDLAQNIFAHCAAMAGPNVVAMGKEDGLRYLGALASYAHLAAGVFFDELKQHDDAQA